MATAACERLILVYDADSGLLGHLRYAARKLSGDSCSLCDITHRGLSETGEWQACKIDLGVPVDVAYRNELDAELAAHVSIGMPCVIAQTATGYVGLLGPRELEDCAGSADALRDALVAALARIDARHTA